MASVASDLISNIESFQQLLTTLALGVAAGAFALVMQVIFHNAGSGTRIKIAGQWPILIGIVLELASILFGVLTRSALVASIPKVHAVVWGTGSATEALDNAGLGHISVLAVLQFGSFFLGAVLLIGVLGRNWSLLKGSGT